MDDPQLYACKVAFGTDEYIDHWYIHKTEHDSSVGFGVYSDENARKEAEKAEKARQAGKKAKKKAVGSEFFNNMAGLFGDNFMKLGATIPPCDWRTRDAFANMDVAGYNYGIFRLIAYSSGVALLKRNTKTA